MEFVNALRLKVFWNEISAEDVMTQLALFRSRRNRGLYFFPEIQRSNLMHHFQTLSEETPRLRCRTMDILHVACALELKASEFLTFDKRQAALANSAGLTVPTLG
jgi:predicted nucleic acid-binding protein